MRITRWRLLLVLLLAFTASLVLVIPPTHPCLWGWLRGEVCYRGKPVSYWRCQPFAAA